MKDRLVILGSHPRTRGDAPFDDPDVDIWAFNEVLVSGNGFCKRADAIFQMHPKTVWNNPLNAGDPKNAEWLKTQTQADVWMLEEYPEVPKSRKYPFDEIRETILPNFHVDSVQNRKDFYGSSVAYSTALAIYLGYKKIDWYGVELEQNDEYRDQVPSATFWAGIAIGRGIDFTAHSYLFDKPLYGIESFITIDKQCFHENITTLEPQIKTAQQEYKEAETKVMEIFEKFQNNNAVKEELEKLTIELGTKAQAFGLLDGAKQENERYIALADAMTQASGSYVFSKHQFARDGTAIIQKREETIRKWSEIGGACKMLLNQIGPKFTANRRELLKQLREAINEYIRLSTIVGLYTGGAQTDYHLREKIPQ
jgi:hypothetical protein